MKLFEFQGKALLKEHGVPIPEGVVIARTKGGTEAVPGKFSLPLVLKAQVLRGGRGKAGGIRILSEGDDPRPALESLFETKLNGDSVPAVLAEERVEILKELYLSVILAGGQAEHILVACPSGGVDVETVAAHSPEKILRLRIDPFLGPREYHIRHIAQFLGIGDLKQIRPVVEGLYETFRKTDADLVEINPLALTSTGVMALDAKVVLDDKAAWRHSELYKRLRDEQESLIRGAGERSENLDEDNFTITYIDFPGDVGFLSDGAGTAMLTLDLINDLGGRPADFCELGSITTAASIYRALKIVLENPRVKSLLIVLIGGFTRMDDMAKGILDYKRDFGFSVPLVVRMCGTMEEAGREMMEIEGITTLDDLSVAVSRAVALAGEA